MTPTKRRLLGALAVLALTRAGAGPAQDHAPIRAVQTSMEGVWSGSFAQREWRFRLRRDNDAWTGRYTTASVSRWQDLQKVAVEGGSVSFTIASSPPLTFLLSREGARDQLSGEVRVGDLLTVPFTAVREP